MVDVGVVESADDESKFSLPEISKFKSRQFVLHAVLVVERFSLSDQHLGQRG